MEKDLQIKYSRALQEVQRERNALMAENNQLKQQLAKKDNKIQVLEKQRNNYRHKRNEYRKQLKPIKQQLAEKDKEIETIKQILADREETIIFAEKTIKGLRLNHNQDKISFAVEQLEKVKDFCEGIGLNMVYVTGENPVNIHMVIGNIDNQIKQLKEGK